VVQTHNVERSITKRFVLVYQLTLEVPLVADLNVLSALNAPMTKHVPSNRNVSILVLTLAVKTRNVGLTIIVQSATAWMDIRETHSLDVTLNHVRVVESLSESIELSCFLFISAPVVPADPYRDPCNPSPCGPYSQCRDFNGSPSCSCLSSYIGAPPNCKPECLINSECPSNQACINEKCRDPCPGSCGTQANCFVINHTPVCTCPDGLTGDPFTNCYPKPISRKILSPFSI